MRISEAFCTLLVCLVGVSVSACSKDTSPANGGDALLSAPLAEGQRGGAGYQRLEIPVSASPTPITAMVWSPCYEQSTQAQLGPYVVEGRPDCEIAGDRLPLIVISHGKGGSVLAHHDTAAALAKAGFVVAAFNQPGDSFGDEKDANSLRIFHARPADASLVITYMLDAWPQRAKLDPRKVGVFGFSRGGYTALVLAGAAPSISAASARLCPRISLFATGLCRQFKDRRAALAVQSDTRVKAAVVVDPLNFFEADGLKNVRIPIQLWASELGGEGVALSHIQEIRRALANDPEFIVAGGAGHFAYLAPCPPKFKAEAPSLCNDPSGFDRTSWHQHMNSQVIRFFKSTLVDEDTSATLISNE